MSVNKKYSYPFTYPIDNDLNIHIENIDGSVSCIWFDNNNQEEQDIPNEFKLYNSQDKIINPFRNTQSYAISSDGTYKINYNKIIIKLETHILLCSPPIYEREIKVITPFRIQNAQSCPTFSVKNAHFVGVFNEKWCKMDEDKHNSDDSDYYDD